MENRRAIIDLLKVRYPIIQAPMAGSDNSEFVAAASASGILGSLGAQYRTAEEIKIAAADIRSRTNKPFAVNLFALKKRGLPEASEIESSRQALMKYYDRFQITPPTNGSVRLINAEEQLGAALEARVPVLSFTLGILSAEWIEVFKRNGTVLLGTATNVKEALVLEQAGVDAIVAQSCEAGGHRGTFIGDSESSLIGGFALIPQIVDAVCLPVIAAGGIMDGRGIAAALSLGASAVQMGTAFLTTTECPVHANYKEAVQKADADDTVITSVFSGGAARGIRNKFILENDQDGAPLLPFPYQNLLTSSIRKAASKSGEIDYTNLWSGQNGRLAKTIAIKDLVDSLVSDTRQKLNALSNSWSE